MPNESEIHVACEVRFTPEFKRNLRQLAKKYHRIRSDIQPVINLLTAGKLPGDQLQGVGFPVYKVRVRNSDSMRGKSGGYRIIYYQVTSAEVILISIYSKSEQQDISAYEIRSILTESSERNHPPIP